MEDYPNHTESHVECVIHEVEVTEDSFHREKHRPKELNQFLHISIFFFQPFHPDIFQQNGCALDEEEHKDQWAQHKISDT